VNTTYKWVSDESGTKLLILQEQTGPRQEHKAKIDHLKQRISNLNMLRSEALLVISRIAFQLKDNQNSVIGENIDALQILSFCGLRLEHITNVLFKNRIYRLKSDPEIDDLGLKNICYAEGNSDQDSVASTTYQDSTK